MSRRVPLTALATLALVLCSGTLATRAEQDEAYEARSAEVVHADGRASQTVTLKRLSPPNLEWYMAGSDLADILGVGRFWRAEVRKLVLRVGDQRITFTAGARSVVYGDDARLLRMPVIFHQGEPWIPLEFVTDVLPQIASRTVIFDAQNFRLRVGQRDINVVGLEVRQGDLWTEATVRLKEPLAFRVEESAGRSLQLKIYGARIDPSTLRLTRPRGLLEGVAATQREGFAQVSLRLSELVSRYQSLAREDGRAIVLRVEQAPVTTIPEPAIKGPRLVQTIPREDRGRHVRVERVVLDPGHGGADMGRTSANGVLEKNVTLAIARELRQMLHGKNGIDVVLTRNSDETLSLVERAERANRARGDLFLSIHCNGWYDLTANGVETYFLSPAQSDYDKSVAQAENAVLGDGSNGDLDFILWDLVQNRFIQESATFAEAVQRRLSRDLGLRNRGVKQAGFRVLVGAYMPAVLVEVGFLSHPQEASRLNSRRFQRRIAKALRDAVLDFRAHMEAIEEEQP